MTLAISTIPAAPVAGQKVTLIGTSDLYNDNDVEWSVTSAPRESKLALGMVLERHPKAARTHTVRSLMYIAAVDLPHGRRPAKIKRTDGSFITNGFQAGMTLEITTSANAKLATVAEVTTSELILSPADNLTTETATSALVGSFLGSSGNTTNEFTPDVPGEWTVQAFEYFTYSGSGGSYEGDPLAVAQKRLMSTATSTVHVGAYLDLPIDPVNGHGSTLRLVIVGTASGGTVAAASLVEPRTELARVAALDSTVSNSILSLVGLTITALDNDLETNVNNLRSNHEAHRVFSAVHAATDTTNATLVETARSNDAAIRLLNDLARVIGGHQEATTAGGLWHAEDDTKNKLAVAPTARTLAQATVLSADLRLRVYARHLTQTSSPASHSMADNTNTLSPTMPLSAAIRDYLDFVTNAAPDIPAGESEGLGDAAARFGLA